MASLEQTSKQLRGLENTIKALKQSISDLNNTFISNELVETDQYALLQAYNIKIRDLENNIKRLKVALGGIGNDELGLAQLNKESSSAISDLNKIIQVVNNINKLLSDVEGKTITFNVSTIDPNKIVNDDAVKAAAKEQERIQREQAAQAKAEADKIKADQNKTKSDNKTNEQLEKQLTLYTTLEQKMSSLSEQARNLGVNIGDITNRASNLRASINQAFDSKNISNAKIHLEQYSRLIDETSNRIKQQEQAIKQQQQTQKQQADEQKRAIQESNKIIQDQINLIGKVAQVVNSGVNQIIKAIRTVINVISKVTSMVVNVVKSITSGIKNILKLLGNFGNRLKSIFTGASRSNEITSTFNAISHSATELRSKILLLKGAFDTLFNGEMAKRGRELLSSVYSLGVLTNNEITNNTLQWAQSLEYAFGISAKGLISDLGEITSLLAGLGFQSEEIAIGSENLILMSRYLASMGAAGGNVDAVTSKIVSGMRGMTTAIDDLGLSVREAEMNSFLKDLKAMGGEFANISTDFSSLNEEARIYVRYAAVISQFTRTYDLTNMVNAMDTITGRMQTMSGLVGSIVTTLGQGLLRLVADFAVFIIPVLNSINTFVENMLNKLFNTINKWFSKDFGAGQKDKDYVGLNTDINQVSPWSSIGDKAAIKNTQDTADAVDDLNKSLEDNTKASKKASGGLQSFDRINNVTTQDSSDLAKNLADEFDYSSLFTSMIDDLNAMADKASESYYEKLDKKFEDAIENFKDNLQNWAEEMTGRADFDLGFDWDKIKENLNTIKANIEHTLSTWGNFFVVLGLKIADDINIGLIITDFTTLIASASTLAATMADVLTPALQKFYDIGLSPIVTYIGEVIDGGIRVFTDELDNWTQWFSDNETLILTFFESLGRVVKAAFETAQPYLDSFFDSITELFTGGNKNARAGLASFMGGFIADEGKITEDVQNAVDTIFQELDNLWKLVKPILENLLYIVGELGKAFGDWATNEGIPWLVEQLKNLGAWLDEHKDEVVELLKTIAGLAWDSFTTFVDLVGQLVTWGVENPGAVAAIFAGLTAIKLGSYFTDAAGGIASFITQWRLMRKLKGIETLLKTGGTAAAGAAGTAAAGAAGAAGTAGSAAAGTAGSAAAGGALAGAGLAAIPAAIAGGVGIAGYAANQDFFKAQDIASAYALEDILASLSGGIERAKIDFLSLENSAKTVANNIRNEYGSNLISEDQLWGVLETVRRQLEETGKYSTEQIQQQLEVFEAYLYSSGVKVEEQYGLNIDNMLSKTGEFKSNVINMHSEVTTEIGEQSTEVSESITEGINKATTASNTLKDTVNSNGTEIIGKTTEMHDIALKTSDGFTAIVESASDLSDTSSIDTSKLALDNMSTSASDVSTGISSIYDESSKLSNTTPIDTARSAFDKLGNILEDIGGFVGDIIVGISEIPSNVGNLISGAGDKFGNWLFGKEYAYGGIVNTATPGVFGEDGPEAIIPLGRDKRTTGLRLWNSVGDILRADYQQSVNKVKIKGAAPITGYANGGSISGGQLFIANEGGGAELIGNIDGSRKTNVANNKMITDAIYEAVYNALADVYDQTGGVNTQRDANININGFGLIDRSTLSELARLLSPYIGANNINIANSGFSI